MTPPGANSEGSTAIYSIRIFIIVPIRSISELLLFTHATTFRYRTAHVLTLRPFHDVELKARVVTCYPDKFLVVLHNHTTNAVLS